MDAAPNALDGARTVKAKQELILDKLLKRLSRYDILMVDEFGYVKQNRWEMEVRLPC